MVNQSGQAGASLMSSDDLRNLFTLNKDCLSDTYEMLSANVETKVIASLTMGANSFVFFETEMRVFGLVLEHQKAQREEYF